MGYINVFYDSKCKLALLIFDFDLLYVILMSLLGHFQHCKFCLAGPQVSSTEAVLHNFHLSLIQGLKGHGNHRLKPICENNQSFISYSNKYLRVIEILNIETF